MISAPRISFIMPAWKSQFLEQAISSIVAQTCQDWELVIVDDCSPEPIREIVDSFNDERIRYVRNPTNIGGKNLVQQWNHSITYATGEFIVLPGDDDLYRESFCAECIRLAEKYPEVDLIRTSAELIDGDGKHLCDDHILPEFTNKYEYLNWWVTGRFCTCVGNYAFRRSALLAMGGFIDFPCAFGSDVATPISLSKNGVANTAEMLFCFRISSGHLSADVSRYIEKLDAISQLFEWLSKIDYEIPENVIDKDFYAVINPQYLHRKVVYDYFNQVIKFLPLSQLCYLKYCRLANTVDKMMMIMRWIKHRLNVWL